MKTRAVIMAGGEGSRLGVLTVKRTKPAVLFAGKYRIIDFTLSNCVNSGIFDVMLLAQYRPHSLIEHIGVGHAFLAYDFLADATGTQFAAPDSGCIMGDERTFTEPVLLRVDVPVEADLLVLRDGAPWQSGHGRWWEGLADCLLYTSPSPRDRG